MSIRLLIVEPDEDVLESHLTFFNRATNFEVESAIDANAGIEKLIVFLPHVLLLEPVVPFGGKILDQAKIPVVVLSRLSNNEDLRAHPSVSEYFVKPKPMAEVCKRIQELASPQA